MTTVTGSGPGEGTGAMVVVVVYGNKGQSEPKVIGESEDFKFDVGQTDEFQVGPVTSKWCHFFPHFSCLNC